MNKRISYTFALSIILILFGLRLSAKVTLPPVLASNMVVQQQASVNLRGQAGKNSVVKISVSWDKNRYKTRSDDQGNWSISIPTPSATMTPQTIKISDGETTILENILIGEVWFCSGQSNMEMPMRGFDRQPLAGTNDIIARAKPSTPIRMFVTDSKDGKWVRQFSKTPQVECMGEWLVNTPENVAVTSATAYFFARYLEDVLEVPVGIIVSTLGGSKIECWMSKEAMSTFPDYDLSYLDDESELKNIHSQPCLLYNAKIAPFFNIPVRGFLWYQGESNRDNADIYGDLMAAFVKDLRTKWNNMEMPFYYVEIAPYRYEGVDKTSGARMREVQSRCLKSIPHSGMASTIDIGHPEFIHPMDKATVGQRLAWLALGDTYGRTGFGYANPVYKSMEKKDNKIYINVENGGNGLCPMWTSLKGFEIAGEDRVFYPAFAEIETSTCRLAVSSDKVKDPVAVRYAYKNYPEVSVYNIHGLPLLPFRTDNW